MIGSGQRNLNILFISAEAEPFVKVGGLGDYGGSLPRAIHELNKSQHDFKIDIRVAIPYHRTVDSFSSTPHKVSRIQVNKKNGYAHGFVYEVKEKGIHYYLIRRAGNPSGYHETYNSSQIDDARKYIFFSLACLQFVKEIDWCPDIIHANDWHTAVSTRYLKIIQQNDPFFKNTKSLLVIHNLPYMGQESQKVLQQYGIRAAQNPFIPDWAKNLPLPIGLDSADRIITVSPSYAEELKSAEFGNGLANFFRNNAPKFSGILNGIDTEIWNPSNDPFIHRKYSVSNIAPKKANKQHLLSFVNMEDRIGMPLFVMISRLTHQKGIDIILQSLPVIENENWTGIILGSGNPAYESGLIKLQSQMPEKLRIFLDYNAPLAHALYAGGDMLLMPSLYEPCGISQMISMRYGCIPIVRKVGGLKDTVKPANGERQTGYLFEEANAQSFIPCFQKAIKDYGHIERWKKTQERAMRTDFSWKNSAYKYLELYEEILNN